MPIVHITDTPHRLVILQCALCGMAQTVPLGKLVLGSQTDPNVIEVPTCECGAQETLARTFDVAPDALASHRKKVNALAMALKAAGQVHPGQRARIAAETTAPAQVGDLVGPVDLPQGMPEIVLPAGLRLPS